MSIDEEDESVDAIESSLSELSVSFKSEMSPAEIEKFVALRGSKLEGTREGEKRGAEERGGSNI
jgi:hypothetical protein